MAKQQYKKIPKSLPMRFVDLINALQIIQNALEGLRQNHSEHLIPLSGQLRALLTDNTKNSKALLPALAGELNKSLEIYSLPDVTGPNLPEDIKQEVDFHIRNCNPTYHKTRPRQKKVTLVEFLDEKIISFNNTLYSPKELINWYANNTGGAHYSELLPEDFTNLLQTNLSPIHPLPSLLFQIGEITMEIGRMFLKSFVDFEMHIVVGVPQDQSAEGLNYMYDSQYEKGPMRFSIFLDRLLKPCFSIQSYQGLKAIVRVEKLIDWRAPLHLCVKHTITKEFQSLLEIIVDGECVASTKVRQPLLIVADPIACDTCLNRALDGDPQKFQFVLIEILDFGRELSPSSSANILLYLEQKRKKMPIQGAIFNPKSFGFSKSGQPKADMTGKVVACQDLTKFLSRSLN